jgi:hypothetical protein
MGELRRKIAASIRKIRHVFALRKAAYDAEKAQRQAAKDSAIARARAPRLLFGTRFAEQAKDKAKSRVEIMVESNDGEEFNFALEIYVELESAGWEVLLPSAIRPHDVVKHWSNRSKEELQSIPATVRIGGHPSGITIVGRNREHFLMNKETPMYNLRRAFMNAGFPCVYGVDEGLPDDMLRIVVGAKQ